MTEDLIKKLKDVKQALVSKDMTGEEWEEREEILEKLEDVTIRLTNPASGSRKEIKVIATQGPTVAFVEQENNYNTFDVLCRDPGIMQERSSDTDGSGSIFIIRWDSMWSAEKHILKVYMAKIFRWISLMS